MNAFRLSLLLVLIVPALALAADASKVKKKAGETAKAAGDYAHETREEFQARMQDNLKKVDAEIQEMKTKVVKASESTKAKVNEDLSALEVKKVDLQKNLDQVKASSAKVWEALHQGINSAWVDLRNAVQKASAEIKDSKKQ